MADQHFSDFDDLFTAGWGGSVGDVVEAAGLFNGTNVRFPIVVNGIDGTVDHGASSPVVKGGDGFAANNGEGANLLGGNAPGAGSGGSVNVTGGNSDSGQAGNVYVRPGVSTSGAPADAHLCDPAVSWGFLAGVQGAAIFGLGDYADDAAAAVGGVNVGYLYWKNGVLSRRAA